MAEEETAAASSSSPGERQQQEGFAHRLPAPDCAQPLMQSEDARAQSSSAAVAPWRGAGVGEDCVARGAGQARPAPHRYDFIDALVAQQRQQLTSSTIHRRATGPKHAWRHCLSPDDG